MKNQLSNLEAAFFEEAQKLCRSAMENTHGLSEAFQYCEGLFPTFALSEFSRIDKEITDCWVKRAKQELLVNRLDCAQFDSFALSMWRFSRRCRKTISDILWAEGLSVCLFGVPTLVDHLPSGPGVMGNLLIDISSSLDVDQKKVFHLSYDINLLDGSEFSEAFDVCVLDPPWYPENYRKWIDVASFYCKKGGILAFPLLGRMTRPTADQDRREILAFCEAKGLEVKVYSGLVLYDLPSFERSMLLRSGVPPIEWKRADLVLARRRDRKSIDEGERGKWIGNARPVKPIRQFEVQNQLVDVVVDRWHGSEADLVRAPRGGYWMKTPSRREEGVADCNVFVSSGARFISDRPFELASALQKMEGTQAELVSVGFPGDVFS